MTSAYLTARATLVAGVLALSASACAVGYSGPARPTTRAAVEAEAGWTLAPAPELRQQSHSDCGPTALAMVAAHWGVEPMRAAANVSSSGPVDNVSFARLRSAARKLGLSAYVITANAGTLTYELRHGRPVVVGLMRPYGRRANQGHYEVVVGVQLAKGLVATIDPAAGWRVRTFDELEKEWGPARHPAMVVLGRFDQVVSTEPSSAALGSRVSSLR
jgi:ABC-type bacteriocin/lantibiotic exporter with double-glycine peptidase domain